MVFSDLNDLTGNIIGAAIEVHRTLGPGLLESTYEHCLAIELEDKGLQVETQVLLPVTYKGRTVENAYRVDMLVESDVIIELKAVEEVLPVHKAQLLSYLHLAEKPLGLLINFNVTVLKDGIDRLYNSKFADQVRI